MKKRFHYRSFVSFILFFSLFWLLISGTVLFIAPPGRVAHWQLWKFMGFDKEQWQAQHDIFSYIFVILAIWHLFWLNWKKMWSYVKIRSVKGLRKRNELIASSVIILFIFLGTMYDIPPFSSFMDLGETASNIWEQTGEQAPIPHMENLTVNEIAREYLKIDSVAALEKLRSERITIKKTSLTLKEIASDNDIAPADLYAILKPHEKSTIPQTGLQRGFGRLTIEQIATSLETPPEKIIAKLKENGIEASASETVKDIAEDRGVHPSEIMGLIRGDHEKSL